MTGMLRLLRRPATGALAGQGTSAIAGFVVQVAAARSLGAAGLAAFSLAYGAIVLATAVCSGLVGDSLTVLNRRDPAIRAGLHVSTALVSSVAGVAGCVLALVTHAVPVWAGLLLGVAAAAFIVEDTLRRLLMATGRFWALTVVDATSVVGAVGVLCIAAFTGQITLSSFVVAMLAGQAGAAGVAWLLLASDERPRGPWRQPDLRAVAAFGSWRAAAQMIRPALLTVLRLLVVAAAGAAAYGRLEAARVLTAPTLVLVAGLGSFLMPHFVRRRPDGVAACLRAADRAALWLAVAVTAIGVLSVLALPWLGPLLTGGGYAVPATAVAGWAAYAAVSAALLPYASLASVHGAQRRVLVLRGAEFGSALAVLLLAFVVPGGTPWTPLALAIGPVLAAVAIRQSVLVPMAHATGSVILRPVGARP